MLLWDKLLCSSLIFGYTIEKRTLCFSKRNVPTLAKRSIAPPLARQTDLYGIVPNKLIFCSRAASVGHLCIA
jgi:hypothetical protein